MACESLEAFGRKVQVDADLHQRLMRARAAATVEIAADAGFEFSVEDVLASTKQVSTELSDEQLEAVAGGLLKMPFAINDLNNPKSIGTPPEIG